MLYQLLAVMAVLLLMSVAIARRSARPSVEILVHSFSLLVVLGLLGIEVWSVLIWVVGLAVLSEYGRYRRYDQKWFLRWAAAGGAGFLACLIPLALYEQHQLKKVEERFSIESLAGRLGPGRTLRSSSRNSAYFAQTEDQLKFSGARAVVRLNQLNFLHKEEVQRFVNSSGFGVSRFIRRPKLNVLVRESQDYPVIRQAVSEPESPSGEPGTRFVPGILAGQPLYDLHQRSIVDFANVAGYGRMMSPLQFVGFLPHGFRESPDPIRVQSIELVSLVLHDPPVVYQSEYLPRMDKLRGARTRPLDSLEVAGLAALQGDEDLYVEETAQRVRLLGAVRNVEQCIQCHGGERGDLLGAFSYVLGR